MTADEPCDSALAPLINRLPCAKAYTCVDGPEFDGRLVDWESFEKRLNQYREEEKLALSRYLQEVGEPTWL